MKAYYVIGDIAKIKNLEYYNPQAFNSITHCCNASNAYNSGLAKQLREVYPKAYQEYSRLCHLHTDDKSKLLGMLQVVTVDENLAVCNLFGQLNFGREKRQLDYDALYRGLEYQANHAKQNPNLEFYYPFKMGCDRAGGNLSIVESMINALFESLTNKVYIVVLNDTQQAFN
jgi:hypothetical protein